MPKLVKLNNYPFLSELHAPTFKLHGECSFPQFNHRKGLWTRCHRCTYCLNLKKQTLIARSLEERKKWPKAWFLTLTYADPTEYNYANVQKMFKRIRKSITRRGAKSRIAYLCTDEYDSSGTRDHNPHHHLVVYGSENLVYRDFDNQWAYGHRKLSLLENRSASYVAKYVTKNGNRIRASQDYGNHTTKYCTIMQNPSLQAND